MFDVTMGMHPIAKGSQDFLQNLWLVIPYLDIVFILLGLIVMVDEVLEELAAYLVPCLYLILVGCQKQVEVYY